MFIAEARLVGKVIKPIEKKSKNNKTYHSLTVSASKNEKYSQHVYVTIYGDIDTAMLNSLGQMDTIVAISGDFNMKASEDKNKNIQRSPKGEIYYSYFVNTNPNKVEIISLNIKETKEPDKVEITNGNDEFDNWTQL